jgi:hypothetical protein
MSIFGNKRKFILMVFMTALIVFLLAASTFIYKGIQPMYKEMQAMKEPRYKIGQQKGAEFCARCHQEIYEQWSHQSSHAEATTNTRFLEYKEKITGDVLLNFMIGEEACYACHGSREGYEGVNCETCHGTVIPGVPIEETHEKKFKPGLEDLKKPHFCALCHQFPETGEGMSLYSEWQESEAAGRGLTCQGCHMGPQGSKIRYHGFDSISRSRDGSLYRNYLKINDISLDFPRFSLSVENRLTSHAIPASGPSRLLVLEISFQDPEGAETHKVIQTFAKRFELMPLTGIWPYKLIENTQLQSGETRPLHFTLPSSSRSRISKALLTLRFYDVSDEYAGDLRKAHWVSEPIVEEKVSLSLSP